MKDLKFNLKDKEVETDFQIVKGAIEDSEGRLDTEEANILVLQNKMITRSEIVLNTTNGYGSTGTKIRRWTNAEINVGFDMTLTQSAVNGDSITINAAGIYGISYTDNFSASQLFGISINGSITTNFHSLAQANRLVFGFAAANNGECVAATRYLTVGDIIRCHTQGTAADSAGRDKFSIILLVKL